MTAPDASGADEVVDRARRLADDVLFPAAIDTDRANRVPAANFDALAAGGLYGLVGSTRHGGLGLGARLVAVGGVVETLASGCLSTTLVWAQHHSLVRALMSKGASSALRAEWLRPLCRGERRAGVALGGVLPGPPRLRATPVDGGWRLDGTSPWVSGWGMIDVLQVGARGPDDTAVWLLVDAHATAGLDATRHRLAALDASATVELTFDGLVVPSAHTIFTEKFSEATYSGVDRLRFNGYFALGVAARCARLMGASDLPSGADSRRDDSRLADFRRIDSCREALAGADKTSIASARAGASYLAWQAASTLVVDTGSRSLLVTDHAQRLAREAIFLLVFGSRPSIRGELLARLVSAR